MGEEGRTGLIDLPTRVGCLSATGSSTSPTWVGLHDASTSLGLPTLTSQNVSKTSLISSRDANRTIAFFATLSFVPGIQVIYHYYFLFKYAIIKKINCRVVTPWFGLSAALLIKYEKAKRGCKIGAMKISPLRSDRHFVKLIAGQS